MRSYPVRNAPGAHPRKIDLRPETADHGGQLKAASHTRSRPFEEKSSNSALKQHQTEQKELARSDRDVPSSSYISPDDECESYRLHDRRSRKQRSSNQEGFQRCRFDVRGLNISERQCFVAARKTHKDRAKPMKPQLRYD
jgi:hypothetical protein